MQEIIKKLFDSEPVLLRIFGRHYYPDGVNGFSLFTHLILEFESTTLLIGVNADDTINVSNANPADDTAYTLIDYTKCSPWRNAIGCYLLWYWILENQQGYSDGVQLEFRRDMENITTTLQVIAEAGEIKPSLVSRIELN